MTIGTATLAIVIPAHNEEDRVAALLRSFPAAILGVPSRTSIVVDDGSTDGTAAVAEKAGAVVLRHRLNLGKGAALRTGCEAARRLGHDVIVVMDADGQHDPADLPRLVAPILAGQAEVALAVRRFAGPMPGASRLGNQLLTWAVRLFFGLAVSDTQCGYRAFRMSAYPKLRWESADYAVESEMLVRMARAQLRHVEVPIATIYHDRYKGTQPVDGLRILHRLILWRLRA